MIIRKNPKSRDSIVVGIWFPTDNEQELVFDNGKKSINYRIKLEDLKNWKDFKFRLEKFITNYVQEQ